MRRALLTLLALVGVGCALVVTASSTMRQAAEAGMNDPLVRGALVGLLEVVNVAGTWTWITDRRPRVRLEAALGVAAASTVTAWCGAVTYGPLGLVAPLGLLAAVHLVSRMWTVEAASAEEVERAPAGMTPWSAQGPQAAPYAAPAVAREDVVPEPPVLDEPKLRRITWPAWPVEHADTVEGRAGPAADRAA